MQNAYVVMGTLTDPPTVTLDEELPLKPMKVRLVIKPLLTISKRPFQEVMAEIRERQRLRGHQPPTREDAERYLQEEKVRSIPD